MNDNAAATERLHDLLTQLPDEDLTRDLGAGWTVTTALGHLAFWDRQQKIAISAWRRGTPLAQTLAVNEALEPILTALFPRAAVQLALDAARELDQMIDETPEDVLTEIESNGHGYMVRRAHHRLDHIAQIEDMLAESG
jgi:uncharacterized damage-inducible protein DinB